MKLAPLLLLALAATALAQTPVPSGEFRRVQLTDQFWAEGAAFADFNRDGKNDVAYGPWWWKAPDFHARHEIYPATRTSKVKRADGTEATIVGFKGALGNENEYSDHFLTFPYDFNGDGWTDLLQIGFPGKAAHWLENPQGRGGHWPRHVAWSSVDNESPAFTDVTGDGRPELVCTTGGFLGFAEPDPANPTAVWRWRTVSPKGEWQRFTHGLGVGDVNGDGRADLLEASGWWEQPASLAGDPLWTKHEALWGKGGAQMLVADVNGDGRNDVITSLEAHGYGVVWFEQTREQGTDETDPKVTGWRRRVIVGSKPEENPQGVAFSQPHALALADMNGDTLPDLVTGKRFWAHGPKGDAEPNAPAVLYWFELRREGNEVRWIAHEIDRDSGVGCQVTAGDVNGDGRPDVLVGNKKGAFVFLRQ